jgi:hypothetical protein
MLSFVIVHRYYYRIAGLDSGGGAWLDPGMGLLIVNYNEVGVGFKMYAWVWPLHPLHLCRLALQPICTIILLTCTLIGICFTTLTNEPWSTGTCEGIDQVNAAALDPTGVGITFIDVTCARCISKTRNTSAGEAANQICTTPSVLAGIGVTFINVSRTCAVSIARCASTNEVVCAINTCSSIFTWRWVTFIDVSRTCEVCVARVTSTGVVV